MVNDGRHVAEAMGIEPQDINLGLIPLSHSYGLGNLAMPLLLQGTTLALRTGFLPSRFVADVEQTRATVFPGVPFMFQHFQEHAFEGPLPRSLRLLLTAGAPIPPATVSYFKQQLGLKIHSFYGSSETGGITYDASQELSEPLSVGRPMPETSVTLRDGRVFVRGNAVSARGYLEGPRSGEGESRFTAGGFLTSDMGRFDDSGRLFLTGRVSSLVNVAGRKVDPLEIEAVLREMGEVAEARVVGVPCERRGQKILACVVPRGPGLSLVALRRHCAQKLSAYKIPHEFVILEALPVDGRGKLDWETLRSFSRRTDRSSQRPG
jgi:long-chain acyl-CoA synthetase